MDARAQVGKSRLIVFEFRRDLTRHQRGCAFGRVRRDANLHRKRQHVRREAVSQKVVRAELTRRGVRFGLCQNGVQVAESLVELLDDFKIHVLPRVAFIRRGIMAVRRCGVKARAGKVRRRLRIPAQTGQIADVVAKCGLQRGVQFFDTGESCEPEQLLLECSNESFDTAVALWTPDE